MRLRTLLILGATLLALLGIGSASALAWTTTLLQRHTASLSEAIESVRAAEELEINLLMLQTVLEATEAGIEGVGPTLLTEQELRAEVLEWLEQVERRARGPRERALVATARTEVEAYLREPAPVRRSHMREAIDATEAVIEFTLAEAHAARAEAQRVSDTATMLSVSIAISVILGTAVVLATTRTRLYRPLLAIRHALAAYKEGQRESRVAETGPMELREIAAEFNDMADTLSTQDARQLQFLAGVAHDLRNPLNALKLSAQRLLRAPTPPPPEKVRESLTRVSTQVDRLERMVGDLLDRTRIEAGNLELRLETCDLRELVTDVVELHRPLSDRHRLELVLPDAPVPMPCDATRLSQVLTNLLNNAIKYSPEGGRVEVRLERTVEGVTLSVKDEGVGIPEGDYDRIFEPFKRGSRQSAELPGIGLGLSVSRRIVRAHGGDIEVESRLGAGSVFRVRLPLR